MMRLKELIQQWLKSNSVHSANMITGLTTCTAGDNFNRATKSIQGVHHNGVNMVLCQAANGSGSFDSVSETCKSQNRSLSNTDWNPEILKFPNIGGKQPGPRHLLHKVDITWLI